MAYILKLERKEFLAKECHNITVCENILQSNTQDCILE